MMNDRLEEFVKANSESFDLHEPDPSLWLRINPERISFKQKRSMIWLRYAAAIAVIFAGLSAGTYYLRFSGGAERGLQTELSKEIMETEAYYNQLVSEKYIEVKKYLVDDRETEMMLNTDLEELDEIYKDLKKDLSDDISNPEVIEAMIQNYRIKLEILEDLLSQFKEMENQDYENNESHSL